MSAAKSGSEGEQKVGVLGALADAGTAGVEADVRACDVGRGAVEYSYSSGSSFHLVLDLAAPPPPHKVL